MDLSALFTCKPLRRLLARALAGAALCAIATMAHAAAGPSCSATSGKLTLQAKTVRSAGISPLLVFFDATATTDSAISGGTTFQNVYYSWNFGDTGVSGTGDWAYGSNAGNNSKNTASGAVAAHLYITNGSDTAYPVTVTAYDGTNTASCDISVTAYNPAGANGFPGTATTCVAASSKPVAGANGCPTGAAVMEQSNMGTALASAFGSGKRVLFSCGNTFTGSYTIGSSVKKASIGAYGSCVNSTSGRPIFQNTSGTTLRFNPATPTDIRVSDIDFEDGTHEANAIGNGGGLGESQITLYNLRCNGTLDCYYMNEATQSGLIQSVATGMTTSQGTYWNYAANNCTNGSSAANCGGNPTYYPVSYNAIMGNSFNGVGTPNNGNGIETVRISACQDCVISNNTFENANDIGAVLKLNCANTWISQATWIGQYCQDIEISDNVFTGTSGAQLVETAPENSEYDERLRNVVVERNLWINTSGGFGRDILVSAVNESVRDNVFYVASGDSSSPEPGYGVQVAQRGVEPVASAVQVYNNTCYALKRWGSCIGFDGSNFHAPAIDSWARNNLQYNDGNSSTVVVNNGSGNTVSNNSSNAAANPLPINANGAFSLIADFEPTENYSSGVEVPVWHDARGEMWSPTWTLGAVKP